MEGNSLLCSMNKKRRAVHMSHLCEENKLKKKNWRSYFKVRWQSGFMYSFKKNLVVVLFIFDNIANQ